MQFSYSWKGDNSLYQMPYLPDALAGRETGRFKEAIAENKGFITMHVAIIELSSLKVATAGGFLDDLFGEQVIRKSGNSLVYAIEVAYPVRRNPLSMIFLGDTATEYGGELIQRGDCCNVRSAKQMVQFLRFNVLKELAAQWFKQIKLIGYEPDDKKYTNRLINEVFDDLI
ncbi:MAG TPA: hypothetical protein VJH68_05630 [Candidatus Nanoarchaeia archaeon]|nr:hypothetical protein [Candidatus Nanoarchaeia archaeon]